MRHPHAERGNDQSTIGQAEVMLARAECSFL